MYGPKIVTANDPSGFSLLPKLPMLVRNLPWEDSFCTRWLFQSATQMLPALSRVMPQGWSNWPGPLPGPPHLATNLPSGLKTCKRLLPLSATITLPFFSTASPAGRSNSPSPLPALPNLLMNLPPVSNTEIVLVHSSEQYTRSRPSSTAMPNGQVEFPSPSPYSKKSCSNSSSLGPPSCTLLACIPKLFSLPRLVV